MPNSDPKLWIFFIHTIYPFSMIFLAYLLINHISFFKKNLLKSDTFSFKEFQLKFKEADASNDRRSVLYVNV